MRFFGGSSRNVKETRAADDPAPEISDAPFQTTELGTVEESGQLLPVPAETRHTERDVRPSRFNERLSIATATSSEIGLSHHPRLEYTGPPIPTRDASARAFPQREPVEHEPPSRTISAVSRASRESGRRQPARSASQRVHAPSAIPEDAVTESEKIDPVTPIRPGLQRQRTTAQTRYM